MGAFRVVRDALLTAERLYHVYCQWGFYQRKSLIVLLLRFHYTHLKRAIIMVGEKNEEWEG